MQISGNLIGLTLIPHDCKLSKSAFAKFRRECAYKLVEIMLVTKPLSLKLKFL